MQYHVIILLPCAHTTPYEGVWDDTMSFCWVCDINTSMLPDNESEQGYLLPWRNEPLWFSTLIMNNKEPQHVSQIDSMRLLQPLWKDVANSDNTKPMSQLLHQGFAREETVHLLTRNLYHSRE